MEERVSEVSLGPLVFPVRSAGPDGPEPVVFLHGFPQTSATWSPYLARLSEAGFRAIAPDQRGYGPTARPVGPMTAAIDYYRALRLGRRLDVGRIAVPTLYVWSTDDPALGPVAARATGDEVDGPYCFEVLDGASHWIPETRIDELSALVLEHARAHAGS